MFEGCIFYNASAYNGIF